MARHLRAALAQVKARALGRLPVDVDQLARDAGHRWRDRKLTPAVTLWLFMLQVLNGNVAISALRHVGGMAASPPIGRFLSFRQQHDHLPFKTAAEQCQRCGGLYRRPLNKRDENRWPFPANFSVPPLRSPWRYSPH